MSETSINKLPGVRWWMKRRSNYYFRNGVVVLLVVFMMGFLFWAAAPEIISIKEVIPLVVMFLFFLFFSCYQFVLWSRSLRWDIHNYWFGKIVDTYYVRNKKRKITSYRIIADINGKTMDGVCLRATYNRAKIGDRVLLFTLDGDKVFCVHPEE